MAKGQEQPSSNNIGGYASDRKREGFGSAMAQILLAAAVAGGALFAYKSHVDEKKRVSDLLIAAREAQVKGTATAFLDSKKKYMETGKAEELDKVVVAVAEISAMLFQTFGMADQAADAQRFIQIADDRDIQKAERYTAKAYLAIGNGNPADAERQLEELLTKTAPRPKILHALSVAKLSLGKAKEAQRAAEEGMKISHNNVWLPLAHGDALLAQGNTSSAKASFSKALAINGDHITAKTSMVLAQTLARDLKPRLLRKEVKRIENALKEQYGETPPPRSKAKLILVKAEINLLDGKLKKAVKLAKEARGIDPRLSDAVALQARALARLGKIKEAKKAFDEATAAVPTSVPYAKAAFAAMRRAGKAAEGVKYLEKTRDAAPDGGHIYPVLAIAYAEAGKVKEALATAEKAIEKLGNAHDEAVFAKARAIQAEGKQLLKKGKAKKADKKFAEAQKLYQEAISFHKKGPAWPEIFVAMGQMRQDQGRWDDALDMFKQAGELYEKAKADVDIIADTYKARGDCLKAKGGRANMRGAQAFYDKAKKVRTGRKK